MKLRPHIGLKTHMSYMGAFLCLALFLSNISQGFLLVLVRLLPVMGCPMADQAEIQDDCHEKDNQKYG